MKEFEDSVANARSNDFDLKLLKKACTALWERSYKRVKGKEYAPSAVVYIDANSTPEKIAPYLGGPTASKVRLFRFVLFKISDSDWDFTIKVDSSNH